MQKNMGSKDIEQLMAEAEEMIQKINSDAIEAMQEEQRLQFEEHAQNLKRIQSRVQGKVDKKGISKRDSGAEGIHEAILDIVKAMRALTKYLS